MSAQNPNKIGLDKIGSDKIGPEKISRKIGPKNNFRGAAPGPKEFMKYVQYFLDQSPQAKNLPLGG